MLIDKWSNITFYREVIPNLDQGIQAIQEQIHRLEVGRYTFEGRYFMVQKGETKPMEEGLFEAHQKYIDVQIVIEGSEEVAWAAIEDLKLEVPYDAEKDVAYLSGETNHHMLISAGMFYIAYPHDGHRPVRHTAYQQAFTKIVLKLPV